MYTNKEVNLQIKKATELEEKEIYNMLMDYSRLKFSWVEQIKKRFLEPDEGGLYTPHRCGLKKEIVKQFYNKYF